jgi:GMP synthase-like glutamine amidotransferase
MLHQKKILILDYSTSRVEASALKRWMPEDAIVSSLYIDTEESFLDGLIGENFTHVIHSGSELSINEEAPFTQKAVSFIRSARDKGIWQMGICYGHQLVCKALVGKDAVRKAPKGFEVGWVNVNFNEQATKLLGVNENEVVWQHHFDEVVKLPEGSELLATNEHTAIQAYVNEDQKIFGTQFHPEFDKEAGDKIFLRDRALLESHHYDVETILKRGPSLDTGKVFFNFFLG